IAEKVAREKKYFTVRPLKHFTFLILSEYLNDLMENEMATELNPRVAAVEKVWEEVTGYYQHFQDWFENRALYHYIGFMIAVRGNQIIDNIISKSQELKKPDFQKYLEGEI